MIWVLLYPSTGVMWQPVARTDYLRERAHKDEGRAARRADVSQIL